MREAACLMIVVTLLAGWIVGVAGGLSGSFGRYLWLKECAKHRAFDACAADWPKVDTR